MEIEVLHHMSLQVSDLARSRRFYQEVLGLEEIERPALPVAGTWLRMGDRELHLIGDGPDDPSRAGSIDIRHTHFAIRVASYARALAELHRLGYREDVEVGNSMHVLAKPNSVVGYPQIYILDPDGYMIEINAQRLDA